MDTDGPGTPYNGIGQGSWEAGVYDYRTLPLPGSDVHDDNEMVASWSYDSEKKQMISFDSEEIGKKKGEWIREEGLAGSMFWELSGDKNGDRDGMEGGEGKDCQPGQSLVRVVKEAMGPLDQSENWLWYDGSQFENMRNGMP
jgi:chitinase